jgi:DNA-binding response OmpR family regulator
MGEITRAKKRVLLVDDEPQIGKIFGIKLRLSGYDVLFTTSGAEAIELARTEKFDVILLDIVMPEVTGLDVLNKVRSFSRIPIVVFTARPEIFEVAKRFGATDFIAKPLLPDELVQKIRNVLGENESGRQFC